MAEILAVVSSLLLVDSETLTEEPVLLALNASSLTVFSFCVLIVTSSGVPSVTVESDVIRN